MSENIKRRKFLNYVTHLLSLVLTVTGCVSVSPFASLVCFPVGITSSAVGIKICAIATRIKKYKCVINKKKKKHNTIVLLGKETLNTIEVLISKALMASYINMTNLFQ